MSDQVGNQNVDFLRSRLICLLFQIFGIKLMSHLSCQFALPKSLSVAKLCINVMFALVGGRC